MKGEKFIRRLAYLRRRWPVRLAIGAIFRNEARYLPEWIEFHQQQGVERFYLYENNSSDDWERALAPYATMVDLRRWRDHPGQHSAYGDCIRRHRWETRWIAFLDVDEFLFSPTGQRVPQVLEQYSDVAAVAVNWRCYGTSGHDRPPQRPVVEAYTFRAADEHPWNRNVKSIVFPLMTSTFVQNPHVFRYFGPAVGEDHGVVASAFRYPPTVDLLRINHYATRSALELREKMATTRADQGTLRPKFDVDALSRVHDPILAAEQPHRHLGTADAQSSDAVNH